MIVEPLQMPQVRRGGGRVSVQMRTAMPGDLQTVSGGDGGDPQPFGNATAPGHIGLQAVHRLRRAHPAEVVQVIAVFPRGDVRQDGSTDLPQPARWPMRASC